MLMSSQIRNCPPGKMVNTELGEAWTLLGGEQGLSRSTLASSQTNCLCHWGCTALGRGQPIFPSLQSCGVNSKVIISMASFSHGRLSLCSSSHVSLEWRTAPSLLWAVSSFAWARSEPILKSVHLTVSSETLSSPHPKIPKHTDFCV